MSKKYNSERDLRRVLLFINGKVRVNKEDKESLCDLYKLLSQYTPLNQDYYDFIQLDLLFHIIEIKWRVKVYIDEDSLLRTEDIATTDDWKQEVEDYYYNVFGNPNFSNLSEEERKQRENDAYTARLEAIVNEGK